MSRNGDLRMKVGGSLWAVWRVLHKAANVMAKIAGAVTPAYRIGRWRS